MPFFGLPGGQRFMRPEPSKQHPDVLQEQHVGTAQAKGFSQEASRCEPCGSPVCHRTPARWFAAKGGSVDMQSSSQHLSKMNEAAMQTWQMPERQRTSEFQLCTKRLVLDSWQNVLCTNRCEVVLHVLHVCKLLFLHRQNLSSMSHGAGGRGLKPDVNGLRLSICCMLRIDTAGAIRLQSSLEVWFLCQW